MYTKEEIIERVDRIAEGMKAKTESVEELKASVLVDRGRLEELKNLYNMIIEAEKKASKAPKKKGAK